MNTNMTWFYSYVLNLCVLVLWTKVASALEGFMPLSTTAILESFRLLLSTLPLLSSLFCEYIFANLPAKMKES